MDIRQNLENIGVPYPASAIYLALIDLGKGNVTDVATKAGLYRPLVYKNLQFLIGKNLVSKLKLGRRWVYIPEPPIQLENTIQNLQKAAQETLLNLMNLYDRKSKTLSISYHEGEKGIKYVYAEMVRDLQRGDTIYRYESPKDHRKNAKYYPEIYWKKATGKFSDIGKMTITNEKTALKRTKNILRETRSIPNTYDAFDYNITELITKDKVGFIDYESESALLIRDPRFAEFQTKLYKLFFRKLEK